MNMYLGVFIFSAFRKSCPQGTSDGSPICPVLKVIKAAASLRVAVVVVVVVLANTQNTLRLSQYLMDHSKDFLLHLQFPLSPKFTLGYRWATCGPPDINGFQHPTGMVSVQGLL